MGKLDENALQKEIEQVIGMCKVDAVTCNKSNLAGGFVALVRDLKYLNHDGVLKRYKELYESQVYSVLKNSSLENAEDAFLTNEYMMRKLFEEYVSVECEEMCLDFRDYYYGGNKANEISEFEDYYCKVHNPLYDTMDYLKTGRTDITNKLCSCLNEGVDGKKTDKVLKFYACALNHRQSNSVWKNWFSLGGLKEYYYMQKAKGYLEGVLGGNKLASSILELNAPVAKGFMPNVYKNINVLERCGDDFLRNCSYKDNFKEEEIQYSEKEEVYEYKPLGDNNIEETLNINALLGIEPEQYEFDMKEDINSLTYNKTEEVLIPNAL